MPLAKTDHTEYIQQMETMLNDPAYSFAWDRISNLKDWVEHNKTISPKIINCLQDMRRKCGDL